MASWALVEADFMREYGIDLVTDLPRLTLRRFMVLVRGLGHVDGGLAVSAPAIVAGAGLIALFLAVKVIGVWPTARAFGLPTRDASYITLLMSTGLTFGTIAALYGLTNGYIDQPAYTILVTVVILSAVVPTLIATTFFKPEAAGTEAFEDFEAAEEIDAGPLRLPPHATPNRLNPPGISSHP